MNNYKLVDKGIITLGEKVMVSDPCYGLGTWCQGVLENVLPGKYICQVGFTDEGDWGTRVADIRVEHVDYNVTEFDHMERFEVGVDSGQAGIYDYEYYAKYHTDSSERKHVDDNWYNMCCNKTEEFVVNPNYFPFIDLPEYKAALMKYHNELHELSVKYPWLDVYKEYEKSVDHYNDLTSDNFDLSLKEVIDALKKLNEILDDTNKTEDVNNEINDADLKKQLEEIEANKELDTINYKYDAILHSIYVGHCRSGNNLKKINRLSANTIGGLGFVSSSGYGDGGYTCWTAHNYDGKVIGILVEFITEDGEDEEDY